MSVKDIAVVVIAGGSGTRFWPLSRKERPKQLLPLAGDQPLIADTVQRVQSLVAAKECWLVVGQHHAKASREALPAVPAEQILTEPAAKNTAPAIALAALHLLAKNPDSVMVVLPADHYVKDAKALCEALSRSAELAKSGAIVTLGIEADKPETGYGYIQRGDAIAGQSHAYKVQRFCEKPDLERARGFLAQGGFYWNAGMFVMKAATYMVELKRQLPAIYQAFNAVQPHLGKTSYQEALARAFAEIKGVSIDYGIMEGARDVAVVPVSCGWSDVGSFGALESILPLDADGNRSRGRAIAVDSHGCVLIASEGHVVATVGTRDLVIVHTPDATLVLPIERTQDVRAVIDRLAEAGWSQYL